MIFVFLHFSITCVIEKWRHFLRCAVLLRLKAGAGLPWPARSAGGRSSGPSSSDRLALMPQEPLIKSEVP